MVAKPDTERSLNSTDIVLEEILLPAVEDRGLQAEFIAELRDALLLQQMPPQDGDLLFRRVVLPLLLHAFIHLTGRTPRPFPTEPEQETLGTTISVSAQRLAGTALGAAGGAV